MADTSGHAATHGGEDWRKSLRQASFRGSFFWVESDGLDGGRRIAVHEFPLSELPYNEDLGQQARRYEVSAYVVGGQAGTQAKALIDACTNRGPATLVLPLFGTIRARCLEISTNRSKDKHGYVSFRLRFVADGLSLSALGGAPHYKSRVNNSASEMPAVIKTAFKRKYKGVGVPEFVVEKAVDVAQAYLDEWVTVIDTAGLRGNAASELLATIGDLSDELPALLESGQTGNTFTQTAYRTTSEDVDTDPFVDAILEVNEKFVAAAVDADTAVVALKSILAWGSGDSLEAVPSNTDARLRQQTNQETLLTLFRRSALVTLATQIVEASYPSRRDAVAARAMIAVKFGDELELVTAGDQWEVLQALRELQGLTIEYLSTLIADLKPVLQIEATALMPSLYWSYRLYSDATRSDELSQRNRIKHPAFMPITFEALSR